MGKKKRRSSETQPPSQPPTTTVDPPTPLAESPPPEILRKGLIVIDILQQGLYLTALQLIEAYVSEHNDSPHLHSLEALIRKHFVEKLVDSFDMKLMNLNQAVTSAESAREKLPNSLYFALLLVELLYERAVMTQEGWDLVIRQCKNAVSIENSTDPGVDGFLEVDEMRNSSKESRIEDGKKQIMRYLHASQHRIKVDAAEMELRMKRMKAVVGDWIAKKQGEFRFSAMKDKGNAKEAKEYKDIWSSSLSAKKKKEFQRVNLKDLEKHFNSLGRNDLTRHLSEAISSVKEFKTWKYWECFCGNKFGDCNMYRSHFRQSHGSTLTLLKEEIGVGNEWIANYLKGEWKPMDTDMATHFIVNQLKSEFDIACENELAVSGDLVENPGMERCLDCYVSDDLVFDMKGMVVFNTHFSSLLLDLRIRGRELNASDIEGIADNASATPFPLNVGQDFNSDNFLSWLYVGLIWGDLGTWTSRRDSQRKKAKEIYQIFEEECSHLKKICKDDQMSKMQCKIKAIQVVDSYIDEIENREKSPKHVAEHCVNFLRQRHEDLEGKDNIDSITESEVISDVLKEALAAVGQAAPCSDQARFRECSPEDGLRAREECLKQIDNRMRIALKSVCEKIVFKNAIVLRSAGFIQQYEMILEKISAYDYQSLILPLLKLFFQGTNRDSVLVQMDREDDNLSPEVGASMSADEVNKSIATYESLPEERSGDHRKSESEPALVVNVLGVGLKNEALDCFLNVIIQSLWHLIEFRVELMSRSLPGHEHIDQNACIFCALKELFSALKKASADKQGEAVDPTYFRNALISHTGTFMKGEKHDAINCLEAILESIHGSFISVLQPTDQDQCFTADCFVHTIFGWDHHERIYCVDCNVESGHQKSTPLSFIVNATDLRMMKDMHVNSSFDELLKLVQMDEKRNCDHCTEKKPIYHTLRCLPHVFTVVLGWAKDDESSEDISRTLSALSTELNLSVIFQGYQPDSQYFLVSMVCFYGDGEHYICFIYNQKLEKYVLYNDRSVEVTGSWKDVVDTSNIRGLQPIILFFHQKSRMKFDETRDVKELPGTNRDSVLVQRDKEDDNLNPEVGASVSADEVNKSIATYKSLPEERSEDHRKSESEPALVVNVLGVGLKNEALDCFLNVIIQSLWHLIEFRVELMSRSIPGHEHIDQNACIFCALKEIFSALKEAYADKQGEAVDPTYFRNALIAHTGKFMKGEKHDAFDCLEVILDSLHGSFISVLQPKDQDQCFTADCFVHKIFGWDHHERIYCGDCNVESGHRKSTPLSFTVNATNLRMMKDTHMNSSFDELLKLVQMDEKRTCDRCREKKHIYHTLRCLPHVFTAVLGWAKYVESSEDISRTLSALSTELNLSDIFQGYQPDSEYFLVSMVCFYGDGEHYICFIYNQKLEKYYLYNDTNVEVTGSWKDVVNAINFFSLQPSILFFHQKSRMKFDETRDVNELLV